ncbi:hypothetical protein ACVGWH_00040, partial [Enterobacter asburiae]
IEALATAWARIADEAEFPADYQGTATPQAHPASQPIHEQIRARIVATKQMGPVSYTKLTLATTQLKCSSGWSPYH